MGRMRKVVSVFYFLLCFVGIANAQYSLIGPNYSQDFNGLGTVNTSPAGGDLNIVNTSLNGWYFDETGTNANNQITAGTGSSNIGDTYNFGLSGNSNRKLGGVRSGTLNPYIGFYFTNNTANPITSLAITYTGETWRVGTASRFDRLDFQYSTNATTLTSGSWTDFDLLDYQNPGQATGNSTIQHSSIITNTITGINIPIGGTFFIRWIDYDATSSDDGMAIEDFTLTASYTPPSTDFFRSIQTGLWSNTTTWESSPTGMPGTWGAATITPTSAANSILIQNGNTVTISSSTSADQLIIQNGAILDFVSGTLTVEDGTGDDIAIQNGGIFTLSQASTPPIYGSGLPTINVNTGGILRVSASGLTAVGAGVNANNFIYEHQSILEYTLNGGFSTSNVVFFPNVNSTTIPIFRVTANSPTIMLVGAGVPTTFNGVFEVTGTATIRWQNAGNRIFRNGIRNTGNIDYEVASIGSGKFLINGTSAELGGTGTLLVPPSGLEIGSLFNLVTVTVSDNKVVTGNINLLSTNPTYLELNASDFSVTGSITGGSKTSYIKTNSTGSFILPNVTISRFAPIGNSTYNPLQITHSDGLNWSLRVDDALQVVEPLYILNQPYAVQREWHITPSTNPPTTGADIVFHYDDTDPLQVNLAQFITTENVQVWHEVPSPMPWNFEWIAAGVAQVPTPVPGVGKSAIITNWTQFSPFAISTFSKPLPIKLVSFNAAKLNSSRALITWQLAACCSKDAKFELEKSTDGRNFSSFAIVNGSETNVNYNYTDSRLAHGANYYRLKAIDTDGKVTYSQVVAVINAADGFVVTGFAPNPVSATAAITISAAAKGNISFSIVNAAGVVVRQWQQAIAEGTQQVPVDVSALPAGVYHLTGSRAGERVVMRFLKQ